MIAPCRVPAMASVTLISNASGVRRSREHVLTITVCSADMPDTGLVPQSGRAGLPTINPTTASEPKGNLMDTKHLGINSKLIHAGHKADATGSVNVPIYQTSTFAFRNAAHGAALFAGEEDGFIYTRIGNPTIRALEDAVAELENGCGGIATSSGMGAICTVYLAFLESGAHMVSTASVYGPSRGLMEKDFSRFGVQSSYVDTSDVTQVENALRPNTKLLYVETPSNPDRKSTRLNSSHLVISYAVFCLK